MNEKQLQHFLTWLDDMAKSTHAGDQQARATGLALVTFAREVHRIAVGDIGAGEGWASIAELMTDSQMEVLFK